MNGGTTLHHLPIDVLEPECNPAWASMTRLLTILSVVVSLAACERSKPSAIDPQPSAVAETKEGLNCPKDWNDCVKCEGGDHEACETIAVAHASGESDEPSDETSIALLRAACGAGRGKACSWLAHALRTGSMGVEPDPSAALKHYKFACNANRSAACVNAGIALATGDLGVLMPDSEGAASFFQKGCELKDQHACASLGALYEQGDGLPKDILKAKKLYETACDQDIAIACFNLGEMYDTGRDEADIAYDHAKAVTYYEKSCASDEIQACNNLGQLLARTVMIPQDHRRAFQLFKKSCEAELPIGCGSLGEAYENGWGVKANREEARKLYTVSCGMENPAACRMLRQLDEL